MDTATVLREWLAGRDRAEPFTFVVALDGRLRLAPRRSEHVALAGGRDVLAAGEMGFGAGWRVTEVTNQSTGYCPAPDCWDAVAGALDRLGISHPGGFADTIVFRRCPACGERNIVRDGDFTCALCGGALPEQWNFATG
ncbi:TFIIB-type zinc ribbon-containing protein [Actinoplanes awajinensis]|uniref:TFIIB-type zinc ribbon-containing protein n=1 Tax=Actinoplanes awajinensis TaxID=135946 RepID=UPI0018DDD838|nr:TFIIB-type zinc ribbon-containing protein [Actinoplanes awajinensis]